MIEDWDVTYGADQKVLLTKEIQTWSTWCSYGQRKKLSDYGNQLFAKQKLKFYYGDLTEKQFRRIYKKASNIKGDTSQILIELLERRLDAIVYRMKFVPTIFAARQLVNHGHVKVNNKRVNIPSYTVKDGDEISLKDKSKEISNCSRIYYITRKRNSRIYRSRYKRI